MAQVTHVEVGYVRQTQPAQYEKAEPSIKFTAKLDEDGKDNHLKVASGLLIDAQVLAHAALGSPLPEKIKNAWVSSGIVQSFLPAYEPTAKPASTPVVNTSAPAAGLSASRSAASPLPAPLQAQAEREADKPAAPAAPTATEVKTEAPAAPKPRGRPKMTEEQKKAAAEARQKMQAITDPSFIPAVETAQPAPTPAPAPAASLSNMIPGDAPASQATEDKMAVVTPPVDQTKDIPFEVLQAYVQQVAGKVPFNTITEIIAAHGGGSKLLADVPPQKYAAVKAAIEAVAPK